MSGFGRAFEEAQEAALSFLVSKHGFQLGEMKVYEEKGTQYILGTATYLDAAPWYRLGASNRFVTLSVAPLRLELDLDVGRGRKQREHYGIRELHQLEDGGEFPPRTHDLYEALRDADQLRAEFERLAGILRACGGRFFADDASLWVDLRRQRNDALQASQDSQMLNKADAAFKAREWRKVVTLLENRESRLNKVYRAKLKYARKHSNNG